MPLLYHNHVFISNQIKDQIGSDEAIKEENQNQLRKKTY